VAGKSTLLRGSEVRVIELRSPAEGSKSGSTTEVDKIIGFIIGTEIDEVVNLCEGSVGRVEAWSGI
jgi:hypothetical protein